MRAYCERILEMMMRRVLALCLLPACASGPLGDGDGVVNGDVGPGWTATLVGTAHDVAGTATLTEDAVVLTDFDYDGGGLNARVYLVVDGAPFDPALELTDNLVGTGPYAGDTLTLPLPSDATAGSFDAITLWCVPAAVSFGFGVFEPPTTGDTDG